MRALGLILLGMAATACATGGQTYSTPASWEPGPGGAHPLEVAFAVGAPVTATACVAELADLPATWQQHLVAVARYRALEHGPDIDVLSSERVMTTQDGRERCVRLTARGLRCERMLTVPRVTSHAGAGVTALTGAPAAPPEPGLWTRIVAGAGGNWRYPIHLVWFVARADEVAGLGARLELPLHTITPGAANVVSLGAALAYHPADKFKEIIGEGAVSWLRWLRPEVGVVGRLGAAVQEVNDLCGEEAMHQYSPGGWQSNPDIWQLVDAAEEACRSRNNVPKDSIYALASVGALYRLSRSWVASAELGTTGAHFGIGVGWF